MPRSKSKKKINRGRKAAEAAETSDLLSLEHRLEAAEGLLTLSFGFRSSPVSPSIDAAADESSSETTCRTTPAKHFLRNTADEKGSGISPRPSAVSPSIHYSADESDSKMSWRSSPSTKSVPNTTEVMDVEISHKSSPVSQPIHNTENESSAEMTSRSSPVIHSIRCTSDDRGSELLHRSSPVIHSIHCTSDDGSSKSHRSSPATNSDRNNADERGSEMSLSVSEQCSSKNFGHDGSNSTCSYLPSVNLKAKVLKNTIYYLNKCERRERKQLKWFFKHFPKKLSTPDMIFSCHLLDLQTHPLLWDFFMQGRDSVNFNLWKIPKNDSNLSTKSTPVVKKNQHYRNLTITTPTVSDNSSNILTEREKLNLSKLCRLEHMKHIIAWRNKCVLEEAPGTSTAVITSLETDFQLGDEWTLVSLAQNSKAGNLPTELDFLNESDIEARVRALDEELKRKSSFSMCSDDTSQFFESVTENCTPWNANDYEGENIRFRNNFNIINDEYYQGYYTNWMKNQSQKNKFIYLFQQRFSQKLLSYFKLHKYVVQNFKKHPLLLTAFYRGMKSVLSCIPAEWTYCLNNPIIVHPYSTAPIPAGFFNKP